MNDNKVVSFIDEVNKERSNINAQNMRVNSIPAKTAQLNKNIDQAKKDCMEYIFADFYKNSIPIDREYITANSEELENQMKDFINRQTADKGVECYVREAIKKGNKSMEQIVESVGRFVNDCFREKKEDIQKFDIGSLNWKFDDDKKRTLDQIAKDANLDEVSSYIRKNVTGAIEYEKQKIADKRDSLKALQEEMNDNDELTSESAIDEYLFYTGNRERTNLLYQPSLFEGVMINKFNHGDTSTMESQQECYYEAVGEFTLLNMNKALRVNSYNLNDVRNLAKQYART